MWPIEYTQEYEDWFSSQEEENKMAINAKVILLAEFGPHLNRPHVDTHTRLKICKFKRIEGEV